MKCEDCRWFWITPVDKLADKPESKCRRYAPQILHGSGAGWSDKKWPDVNYDDWCGEYEFQSSKTSVTPKR